MDNGINLLNCNKKKYFEQLTIENKIKNLKQ